jgi:Tfp pilus assembly protein PilN
MANSIGSVLSDLVKTMANEHPRMLLFVLILVGSSMMYSLRVFAEKDVVDLKFEGVEQRIDSLENKVDLRHMETQLYSLDAEIYQLERLVGDEKANDRDHARLSNLQTQRKNVEGDINDLREAKKK